MALCKDELYMHRHSPDYPVGRSRLEALSVIACAFIMSMASVEGKILRCFVEHAIVFSYDYMRFHLLFNLVLRNIATLKSFYLLSVIFHPITYLNSHAVLRCRPV